MTPEQYATMQANIAKRNAERLAYNKSKQVDAYQDGHGVWRWKEVHRVPPQEFLDAWDLDPETMAKCKAANEADLDRFLAEYRKAQAEYKPTPEEIAEHQFELRAAFGPGVNVTNVVTGQKYTT